MTAQVWLERGCPITGSSRRSTTNRPTCCALPRAVDGATKVHGPDITGNFKPDAFGLRRQAARIQTQHTCILLEDLTDHCNLRCPTCFAESGPPRSAIAPLAEVLASGRRLPAHSPKENSRIDVLMLSGGEPTTLYPWLEHCSDSSSACDRSCASC
ncbi:MAG: hypothetical protein R2692_05560 [Microbacterium sp.]